jgi:hypothetical protein
MSPSIALSNLATVSVKPSKTAIRIIIAAVGTATAMRLTHAIVFITECDFGENI